MAATSSSTMAMHALGQWGMTYPHDRIKRSDLDPALLIWGLRKRVDLSTLPDRRVVLRFEFSGVPASRTKFRIMCLVLERSGVDVCMKDPGFAVDLTLHGNIRDCVEVYLGHTIWRDVAGTALRFDGDLQIARAFPVWLRFETVNRGRVVNARSDAKHGGKPRKIGEGRAIGSGERPGVSSSHLGAFATP
jgi:hypothetical protein